MIPQTPFLNSTSESLTATCASMCTKWQRQDARIYNQSRSASELARGRRAQVGKDAVVVEADAIKNRDTVYRALTSLERDMDSLSDVESLSSYVHEYSTKAAEALLVAAGAHP